MTRFTRAILCEPGEGFEGGLTEAGLGRPDLALARAQHARYAAALVELGLELTVLPPDPALPDSTFVEDTAVLTARVAVLTRPGAESRRGETVAMRAALSRFYPELETIVAPATVDGGDVCETEERIFIGLSHRTNEEGARALARILGEHGIASTLVDIRRVPGLLHLKSAIAWPGGEDLVVTRALAAHAAFHGFRHIVPEREEEYAANCVAVNGRVLVPSGFPRLTEALEKAGHRTKTLAMSEFQKQDGGLSCLSLRF